MRFSYIGLGTTTFVFAISAGSARVDDGARAESGLARDSTVVDPVFADEFLGVASERRSNHQAEALAELRNHKGSFISNQLS